MWVRIGLRIRFGISVGDMARVEQELELGLGRGLRLGLLIGL